MPLPNARRAVVPIQKLAGYSLDPEHETGAHKARVFRAALGLTAADAGWLRDRILDAVATTDAVAAEPSPFGAR